MKSGVTSSLSPNQNASTSLRPMPAFATSRIFDSSRFWMAWRIRGRVSTSANHRAGGRHFRLSRLNGLHHAEAVTRAFDVELHPGRALALHHTHDQLLLELVVGCAHPAGLSLQVHRHALQRIGNLDGICAARLLDG